MFICVLNSAPVKCKLLNIAGADTFAKRSAQPALKKMPQECGKKMISLPDFTSLVVFWLPRWLPL
jgi:hypothetical protein